MPEPTHIHSWRRLGPTLTTSGQPSAAQLAEIRDLGTRHVVNLALHSHALALPDEAARIAALGMSYTHIPVDFDRPTEADFERFCDAMTDFGEAAVHVHCIVNARVSLSCIAIAATGSAGTKPRLAPRWKRSGDPAECGPRLSAMMIASPSRTARRAVQAEPTKKGRCVAAPALRLSAGGTWFG